MTGVPSPRFIIAGELRRDYAILSTGETLIDTPGGSVLYAAAGLAAWEPDPPPGMIARVGEDYPRGWIEAMQAHGLDTRGIQVLAEPLDLRNFYIYTDRLTRSYEDPVAHFARLGHAYPKALLGYQPATNRLDSRTRLTATSIRQADVPADYREAQGAHLCPLDFLSHSLLPAIYRQMGITTVTLDPSPGYMSPLFWNDIPSLLTGLTAFLPSEEEIRSLFLGRSSDLWQMAEALCAYGCEFVVIKRGAAGQYLYDSSSKTRWEIPAYPCHLDHPTGAGDAFCGGFLAGYRRHYDPLAAALYGSISSSLVIEGRHPFYALDALPGLSQARLEALKANVRKV